MEVVETVAAARVAIRAARSGAALIGAVPTMGALHEGHASLIRRARAECGFVVVTLFVNPTQFGPNEDLSRYPRTFEADCRICEDSGADLLFAPNVREVYPDGFATYVTVDALTTGLCGASRPTHFRGVTTVVSKLFNMLQPDRAYFGEKDYQQLAVIQRMTRDLDFPVEIVPCAIVREADGLAMSSRNRYLTEEQRRAATALSRGLAAAREAFAHGERHANALLQAARAPLEAADGLRIDYVELVDAGDLTPVEWVAQPALLALAAFLGDTRLIDNTVLKPVSSKGCTAR